MNAALIALAIAYVFAFSLPAQLSAEAKLGCLPACPESSCDSCCQRGAEEGRHRRGCLLAQAHGCCGCRPAMMPGIEAGFNCCCQGSYNFPAPPQSKYHWPGMYKDANITDYQNSWIRPHLRRARDVIAPSRQPAELAPAASMSSVMAGLERR